ncbi:MAG: Crp/Fnr family transcriptional regulator [Anaerolineae bacterium]|nr:Crp/Fnr family transcriptional regulator [Anaerolineae bacterium]MCB0203647.1 Crp/Fnr family transcriptional regulator [Anaerolineae bacterium]MCB0256484.1 Crp/Fnr family transcriptional regulator [Anaerolineae bacterium]
MSQVDLLRNAPIFESLNDSELEALAASLKQRVFARGVVIFHKGSPGNSLYLIERGKVRIFILSDSGQEITINVHGPDECFGELALLDGLPRSASAVSLDRTTSYVLQREDFLATLESHPGMARAILALLSSRVRHATAYAESLAFLDVKSRIASTLLALADRHGVERQGVEIDLRLTQSDLASYVAASRESVNKALGGLRDQGLVAIDGHTVTVINTQGLRDLIQY